MNRFKKEFSKLTESTVRGWLTKYRSQLRNTLQIVPQYLQIGRKRGRPLFSADELDFKLRSFIINLTTAGVTINRYVLYGVLMGQIKSDLAKYGQYLIQFRITNGWVQPCSPECGSLAELRLLPDRQLRENYGSKRNTGFLMKAQKAFQHTAFQVILLLM